MGTVKLRAVGLVKEYADRNQVLRVLDRVDLHVDQGELVCLVGASGCGKSTLLNIAAGLVAPSAGEILLDGHPVRGPGADRGLVFQSYTLYPWRTVAENVAFGLELKKLPRSEIREKVDRYLGIMGLTKFADVLPRKLSGGMEQRAAIARALATEPEVLLLDEPFGALDAQTRGVMREFLLEVWATTGTTILMVTHDVEEAVFLSQRIYVMSSHPGRVAAELRVPFPAERPRDLLRHPGFQDLCAEVDDLLHTHAVEAMSARAP